MAERFRTCNIKPIEAIAPGIHPIVNAANSGFDEKNGTIEHATAAMRNGISTKDRDGVGLSFSMTQGARDDHGRAIQIAGMRYNANGVNIEIKTGAKTKVIFIHHISGRGAASKPSVGKNWTTIVAVMVTVAIHIPKVYGPK